MSRDVFLGAIERINFSLDDTGLGGKFSQDTGDSVSDEDLKHFASYFHSLPHLLDTLAEAPPWLQEKQAYLCFAFLSKLSKQELEEQLKSLKAEDINNIIRMALKTYKEEAGDTEIKRQFQYLAQASLFEKIRRGIDKSIDGKTGWTAYLEVLQQLTALINDVGTSAILDNFNEYRNSENKSIDDLLLEVKNKLHITDSIWVQENSQDIAIAQRTLFNKLRYGQAARREYVDKLQANLQRDLFWARSIYETKVLTEGVSDAVFKGVSEANYLTRSLTALQQRIPVPKEVSYDPSHKAALQELNKILQAMYQVMEHVRGKIEKTALSATLKTNGFNFTDEQLTALITSATSARSKPDDRSLSMNFISRFLGMRGPVTEVSDKKEITVHFIDFTETGGLILDAIIQGKGWDSNINAECMRSLPGKTDFYNALEHLYMAGSSLDEVKEQVQGGGVTQLKKNPAGKTETSTPTLPTYKQQLLLAHLEALQQEVAREAKVEITQLPYSSDEEYLLRQVLELYAIQGSRELTASLVEIAKIAKPYEAAIQTALERIKKNEDIRTIDKLREAVISVYDEINKTPDTTADKKIGAILLRIRAQAKSTRVRQKRLKELQDQLSALSRAIENNKPDEVGTAKQKIIDIYQKEYAAMKPTPGLPLHDDADVQQDITSMVDNLVTLLTRTKKGTSALTADQEKAYFDAIKLVIAQLAPLTLDQVQFKIPHSKTGEVSIRVTSTKGQSPLEIKIRLTTALPYSLVKPPGESDFSFSYGGSRGVITPFAEFETAHLRRPGKEGRKRFFTHGRLLGVGQYGAVQQVESFLTGLNQAVKKGFAQAAFTEAQRADTLTRPITSREDPLYRVEVDVLTALSQAQQERGMTQFWMLDKTQQGEQQIYQQYQILMSLAKGKTFADAANQELSRFTKADKEYHDPVARESTLSVMERVALSLAITREMQRLTGLGFTHNDIKPENFTYKRNPDGSYSVQFIDWATGGFEREITEVKVGTSLENLFKSRFGDGDKPYSSSADLYFDAKGRYVEKKGDQYFYGIQPHLEILYGARNGTLPYISPSEEKVLQRTGIDNANQAAAKEKTYLQAKLAEEKAASLLQAVDEELQHLQAGLVTAEKELLTETKAMSEFKRKPKTAFHVRDLKARQTALDAATTRVASLEGAIQSALARQITMGAELTKLQAATRTAQAIAAQAAQENKPTTFGARDTTMDDWALTAMEFGICHRESYLTDLVKGRAINDYIVPGILEPDPHTGGLKIAPGKEQAFAALFACGSPDDSHPGKVMFIPSNQREGEPIHLYRYLQDYVVKLTVQNTDDANALKTKIEGILSTVHAAVASRQGLSKEKLIDALEKARLYITQAEALLHGKPLVTEQVQPTDEVKGEIRRAVSGKAHLEAARLIEENRYLHYAFQEGWLDLAKDLIRSMGDSPKAFSIMMQRVKEHKTPYAITQKDNLLEMAIRNHNQALFQLVMTQMDKVAAKDLVQHKPDIVKALLICASVGNKEGYEAILQKYNDRFRVGQHERIGLADLLHEKNQDGYTAYHFFMQDSKKQPLIPWSDLTETQKKEFLFSPPSPALIAAAHGNREGLDWVFIEAKKLPHTHSDFAWLAKTDKHGKNLLNYALEGKLGADGVSDVLRQIQDIAGDQAEKIIVRLLSNAPNNPIVYLCEKAKATPLAEAALTTPRQPLPRLSSRPGVPTLDLRSVSGSLSLGLSRSFSRSRRSDDDLPSSITSSAADLPDMRAIFKSFDADSKASAAITLIIQYLDQGQALRSTTPRLGFYEKILQDPSATSLLQDGNVDAVMGKIEKVKQKDAQAAQLVEQLSQEMQKYRDLAEQLGNMIEELETQRKRLPDDIENRTELDKLIETLSAELESKEDKVESDLTELVSINVRATNATAALQQAATAFTRYTGEVAELEGKTEKLLNGIAAAIAKKEEKMVARRQALRGDLEGQQRTIAEKQRAATTANAAAQQAADTRMAALDTQKTHAALQDPPVPDAAEVGADHVARLKEQRQALEAAIEQAHEAIDAAKQQVGESLTAWRDGALTQFRAALTTANEAITVDLRQVDTAEEAVLAELEGHKNIRQPKIDAATPAQPVLSALVVNLEALQQQQQQYALAIDAAKLAETQRKEAEQRAALEQRRQALRDSLTEQQLAITAKQEAAAAAAATAQQAADARTAELDGQKATLREPLVVPAEADVGREAHTALEGRHRAIVDAIALAKAAIGAAKQQVQVSLTAWQRGELATFQQILTTANDEVNTDLGKIAAAVEDDLSRLEGRKNTRQREIDKKLTAAPALPDQVNLSNVQGLQDAYTQAIAEAKQRETARREAEKRDALEQRRQALRESLNGQQQAIDTKQLAATAANEAAQRDAAARTTELDSQKTHAALRDPPAVPAADAVGGQHDVLIQRRQVLVDAIEAVKKDIEAAKQQVGEHRATWQRGSLAPFQQTLTTANDAVTTDLAQINTAEEGDLTQLEARRDTRRSEIDKAALPDQPALPGQVDLSNVQRLQTAYTQAIVDAIQQEAARKEAEARERERKAAEKRQRTLDEKRLALSQSLEEKKQAITAKQQAAITANETAQQAAAARILELENQNTALREPPPPVPGKAEVGGQHGTLLTQRQALEAAITQAHRAIEAAKLDVGNCLSTWQGFALGQLQTKLATEHEAITDDLEQVKATDEDALTELEARRETRRSEIDTDTLTQPTLPALVNLTELQQQQQEYAQAIAGAKREEAERTEAAQQLILAAKHQRVKIHVSSKTIDDVLKKLNELVKLYQKTHPTNGVITGELIKLVEYYREHRGQLDTWKKDHPNDARLTKLKEVETCLDREKAHDIFVTYVRQENIAVCRTPEAVRTFNTGIENSTQQAEPHTPETAHYYFKTRLSPGITVGFKMQVDGQTTTADAPAPITVGWTVQREENGGVIARAVKPIAKTIDDKRIDYSGVAGGFPSKAYILWAITMLENYKSANGGYPDIIRGGWHQDFVEAALLYCALKDHTIENTTTHHKDFAPDKAKLGAFSQLLGKGFKEQAAAADDTALPAPIHAEHTKFFATTYITRREVCLHGERVDNGTTSKPRASS